MIELYKDNFTLYKPDKQFYLRSLEFAKTLEKNNAILIFHCFWRVPKDFGRKQYAVLVSILVHHRLENIQIHLWSNIDLSNYEILKDIKKYIIFHIWDFNLEKQNTILNNLDKEILNDDLCYLEGDLFRLLVLHKYGGIYIDMDVLVLRDMSPLHNLEFIYQWGTSIVVNNNTAMNGAIMKLNKGSAVSSEFLELIMKIQPSKDTPCWGSYLYSKLEKNNILVLPCIWFDSEWGFPDTINEPFKKIDTINMFDGAFTWHWHNRWDYVIENGSKFQILEEKHLTMFRTLIKE